MKNLRIKRLMLLDENPKLRKIDAFMNGAKILKQFPELIAELNLKNEEKYKLIDKLFPEPIELDYDLIYAYSGREAVRREEREYNKEMEIREYVIEIMNLLKELEEEQSCER